MSSFVQSDQNDLNGLELLRGLAPDDLDRLHRSFHRRMLRRGQHLFHQEQQGEAVFLILSGSVKVYALQRDGREATLSLLGVGELVGASCLVESRSYAVSAGALEQTVLLTMDRAAFLGYLRAMPALSYNLNRILARRLRLATEQAQLLAIPGAAGRVACLLLSMAREVGRPGEGGVQIPLRITQGDLAGLAGITRSRANQALGAFRQNRWVAVGQSGRLVLLDPSALAARCLFPR